MNIRILLVFVVFFASFLIITFSLYLQQNRDISGLQAEINVLKSTVAALQGSSAAWPSSYSTASAASIGAIQYSSGTITDLIPRIEPVVVRIDVTGTGFSASGSGFIIDKGGYILTNQHIIDAATLIKATLQNGRQYAAEETASNKDLDLAIIKLSPRFTDLPAAELGEISDIVLGEEVIAAGFPLGPNLPGPASFTRGIVSAVRELDNIDYIQTDITISPGSSGGCLVTMDGKVIGITNAAVISYHVNIENVGLAIPVDVIRSFIQDNLKR